MFKRGVKFFLILFFVSINSFPVFCNDTIINYTISPDQNFLNGKYDKDNKFIGGYHSLIKKIMKDMNIELRYIPYDNYNKSVQNTMIYNPKTNPEIMIGNFFEEKNTKYLYYLPTPIFEDYIVVVANKNFISNSFKYIKGDLDNTLIQLLDKNILLKIDGQNFPDIKKYPSLYEYNINTAMEKVFTQGNILITTFINISDYIEKNKGTKKLDSLIIYKYPEKTIPYFLTINKQSNLFIDKYNENNFMIDKIEENLKNLFLSNEILNILEK